MESDRRWKQDSCFGAFTVAWIWIYPKRTRTKLSRYSRRSIRAPGRKSRYRSGFAKQCARQPRQFIATAVSIATMSDRRRRRRTRRAPKNVSQPDMAEGKE